MATPRVIDLDAFDKRRYPKALAKAYPFKLRGQVVALADADTVEVFVDQAFGDTTTVNVRIANLSAAEKRSRDPIEKGLGIAAWAEALDILYAGRPIGLTSLKVIEPFGTSLGRVLGLIEVEHEGIPADYGALMLLRKMELAKEGIELGVWPSEEWPFAGMPPRSQDASNASLSSSAGRLVERDNPTSRVAYTGAYDPEAQTERLAMAENHEAAKRAEFYGTDDPQEQRRREIFMDPQEREAMERTAAKEHGRTTPRFNPEEDTTRESMHPNPAGGDPLDRGPFLGSDSGRGPLRDSEDRTSNFGAKDLPRDWQQQQSEEAEPVSIKTEPTRIVNIAVVVVLVLVNGAGIVLSDEETNLITQGVELLVEIATVTGLLQYLRTKVWSESTHKTEVREALYKQPPVR